MLITPQKTEQLEELKTAIVIVRFLPPQVRKRVKMIPDCGAAGRAMSSLTSAVHLPFPELTHLSSVKALLCEHQLHCELN